MRALQLVQMLEIAGSWLAGALRERLRCLRNATPEKQKKLEEHPRSTGEAKKLP